MSSERAVIFSTTNRQWPRNPAVFWGIPGVGCVTVGKLGHGEAVPLDHEGQAVVAKMSKRVRISGGSGTSNNRRASLRLPSPPVALPTSAQGRRRSRPARTVNLPLSDATRPSSSLGTALASTAFGTDLDPKAAQRYTALAANSSAAFGPYTNSGSATLADTGGIGSGRLPRGSRDGRP